MAISVPALKTLGNFAAGNENQTQKLIEHGFFNLACTLIKSPKKAIRRETCWILSNIAAGNNKQKVALLGNNVLE